MVKTHRGWQWLSLCVFQIYPNQSIYAEEVIPVLARKIKLAKSPTDSEVKKYSYQLHYTGREPYVKFLVDGKVSKNIYSFIERTSHVLYIW